MQCARTMVPIDHPVNSRTNYAPDCKTRDGAGAAQDRAVGLSEITNQPNQ
jgi:hypothetical protein